MKFSLERARNEDRQHKKEETMKKYDRMWDFYSDSDPILKLKDAARI